jgi:4-diphosphocytidyl-2-C-methyl-D-erythritol kinase
MSTQRRLRVRAHAKINLTLHVRGTRDDGYHELETVFQSLALHDVLTCRFRPGPFVIRCDEPGVPDDERNLIWRAAQRLWERLDREGPVRGVEIVVDKQIPMQAGLGGGSADAAAALVALSRAWSGDRPVDLAEVAALVGADVPYFLMGGTALGLSRGDRLYPLPDLPPCQVVLGLPAFGVSTADAYGWFDRDLVRAARRRAAPPPARALAIRAWPGRSLVVGNDLEAPVVARHPDIGVLRDALMASGARASSMTGSGSAVFGLFDGVAQSRRAARALAELGVVALVTQTTDVRPCANRRPSYTLFVCVITAPATPSGSFLATRSRFRILMPVRCQPTRAGNAGPMRGGAVGGGESWRVVTLGRRQAGKARDFGSRIRRFESFRPSQPG